MSIGGSLFIHNAIDFDYCIEEAIGSLAGFCDEIVVLDASSTDGTVDLLKSIKNVYPFQLIENIPWEIAEDRNRLVLLANMAKDNLKTKWHFMLQADEVIHENSYESIRTFVKGDDYDSILCKRFNLWGDFDTYIKDDSSYQPCSHEIVRLGRKELNAYGDAESIESGPRLKERPLAVFIFHYGFMRSKMIEKTISMQSWFWGKGSQPDKRYIDMKETGFKPYSITPPSELIPLPMSHPAIMENWIRNRKGEYAYC